MQDSPLGPLVVTASGAGVRSVRLHGGAVDGPGEPDRAVARCFDRYFAGEAEAVGELPVDLEGLTPFCRGVLLALRRLAPGQLTTYGRVAREVGRTGAARATGRAVGANPVPIVVPCHRVIAGDGSLGGYSGGLAVKRWLLAHEGHHHLARQ